MISKDEALALVLEHTPPGREISVDLAQCAGLTLAQPVLADRDYPPFDRAMMDGYAVRLADAGQPTRVVAELRAGTSRADPIEPGTCVEIMTGAPCPPGTEAVVPREIVARDGAHATAPTSISAEMHIVRQGRERRQGEEVLPAGAVLTPLALGVAAAVGRDALQVFARPSLAVITTGDELVQGAQVGPAQIRNSNGPMLVAMARGLGITEILQLHAVDSAQDLARALDRAAGYDLLVLTGGVSAGNYDLVPAALAAYGATERFHKVTQKPGKPLLFATRDEQLLFGLPGTPLGAHLGFHRYVTAALRAMQGGRPRAHGCDRGTLTTALSVHGEREKFLLASVEPGERGWSVSPLSGWGSSDLTSAATANAYLHMPAGEQQLPAGATIDFEWTAGLPDGGRE